MGVTTRAGKRTGRKSPKKVKSANKVKSAKKTESAKTVSAKVWQALDNTTSITENGRKVTQTNGNAISLTRTREVLTTGRYYREFKIKGHPIVGVCKTGCATNHAHPDGWWYASAPDLKNRDRVGMLVDLDDGSLRFFKNGVEQRGDGHPAGTVKGPVAPAVVMFNAALPEYDIPADSAKFLPDAKCPDGVNL